MAIKSVFETSFALEKFLLNKKYSRSEPRVSISALGISINVFSSIKEIRQNKLIIEVLPPYCCNFELHNFGPDELEKAEKYFFENLECFITGLKQNLSLEIRFIILHGAGCRETPKKVCEVDVKFYTSKEEKNFEKNFTHDCLVARIPEVDGVL
jgi:hypothetical protein